MVDEEAAVVAASKAEAEAEAGAGDVTGVATIDATIARGVVTGVGRKTTTSRTAHSQ